MNSINLVVFDLDGVLVDSKEIHYNSLNLALKEIDEKYIISKDDHNRVFDGLSTNKKLEILTDTRGLRENLYNKIWSLKQEKSIVFFDELKVDHEIVDIIKYLKEKNIKVAVASNSIKKTVESCLKNLGILDLVDVYFSNEDVSQIKPSSEIYIKCMNYFNISHRNTLIIEDSYFGKVSAINSGAKLVSVENRKDININFIKDILENNKRNINILIPMAGEGKRMREYGWNMPKPMIPIGDKTMIQTVVDNMGIDGTYIYVVKEKDLIEYGIDQHLYSLNKDTRIVRQSGRVAGAALSTLIAKDLIDNADPLLIVNSDQHIIWDKNELLKIIDSGVDGCIFSFKDKNPKWSFSKLNEHGFVTAVAEKNPISDNASCGIYFWKKGSDYVKYAEKMISKGITTSGEFYVCPAYNEAIEDKKVIKIFMVEKMYGLGTPEDLLLYLNSINKGVDDI